MAPIKFFYLCIFLAVINGFIAGTTWTQAFMAAHLNPWSVVSVAFSLALTAYTAVNAAWCYHRAQDEKKRETA